MNIKDYTKQNRLAWNQVTPLHLRARQQSLYERLASADYVGLDALAVKKLLEHHLRGRRTAQICCNTGVETVSLKKLGASSCVGFDISDDAISEAKKLVFICTLSAAPSLHAQLVSAHLHTIRRTQPASPAR
jgi:hypothetical protein